MRETERRAGLRCFSQPAKHLLDHAQAEWKSEIEPDRVTDYFRWEAVAAIERITDGAKCTPLTPVFRSQLVKLTVPFYVLATGCQWKALPKDLGTDKLTGVRRTLTTTDAGTADSKENGNSVEGYY